MRKTILTIVLAFALVFGLTIGANAGYKDMWAQVYTWDGSMTADGRYELTKVTSGITFVVMQRNSVATLETLYYYNNDAMTSLANPVTGTSYTDAAICGDKVSFRVDPSETTDTYVDLIVVDQAGGYTAFVEDFNENKHSIIIDERPNIRHHGCAFIVTTGSSSEIDTGIDFDDISVIDDMIIEVGTAFETDVAINVGILSTGTGGDPNGFIEEMILATAGYHALWSATDGAGAAGVIVSSGGERAAHVGYSAMGTLLGNWTLGTSVSALANAGIGIFHRHDHIVWGTLENSLSYTFGTTACSTGWGLIHFWFTRIR